jgi:hypothetical protein
VNRPLLYFGEDPQQAPSPNLENLSNNLFEETRNDTPIPVQNKRDFLEPIRNISHSKKEYFYYKKISIVIKKE